MYKTIALIFLSILPLWGTSIEKSVIKAGTGFPVFTKSFFPGDSDPGRFFTIPKYSLFLEKPFSFAGGQQLNLSFSPGISFFYMNQHEGPGTALGGGSELDLKRYSFSSYFKLLYHHSNSENSKYSLHAGMLAGVQLIRTSEGSYSWWMYQQGGAVSGKNSINQRKDPFFRPVYFGFLAGIAPVRYNGQFLTPGLEVSYYPVFIDNNDNIKGSFSRKGNFGMAFISLFFAIGR